MPSQPKPTIDPAVKAQIISMQQSGLTNMYDFITVQRLAFEREYYELVSFLESDKKTYAEFISKGDG